MKLEVICVWLTITCRRNGYLTSNVSRMRYGICCFASKPIKLWKYIAHGHSGIWSADECISTLHTAHRMFDRRSMTLRSTNWVIARSFTADKVLEKKMKRINPTELKIMQFPCTVSASGGAKIVASVHVNKLLNYGLWFRHFVRTVDMVIRCTNTRWWSERQCVSATTNTCRRCAQCSWYTYSIEIGISWTKKIIMR